LRLRTRINEAIEPRRAAGQLGKSLDASVALAFPPGDPVAAILGRHQALLAELFIVSHVSVEPQIASHPPRDPAAPAAGVEAVAITVRHSEELDFIRCPRCWRWVPGLDSSRPEPVCSRCVEALNS
jgi:isoleucyl-tRNA synthetase